MTDETREHHVDHAGTNDGPPEQPGTSTIIEDNVLEMEELLGIQTALESYKSQIAAAGRDGLDPVAKEIMLVNLRHLSCGKASGYGLESLTVVDPESIEDILSKVTESISKHT